MVRPVARAPEMLCAFAMGARALNRPVLHGFEPSVYTRAARLGLRLKGVAFEFAEANPFDPDACDAMRALHPFGRVPVLVHSKAQIYETGAILDYVDAGFEGPALTPPRPLAKARMRQVQGISDSYGYWPMVRQVYVQGVARAASDAAELAAGLAASEPVLAALDQIAAEALVLDGAALTLADAHLYPMVDYFQRYDKARKMLDRHPSLAAWYEALSAIDVVREICPEAGA